MLDDFIQTEPYQLGQSLIINQEVLELGTKHGVDPTVQGNENEKAITKEDEKTPLVYSRRKWDNIAIPISPLID